MLQETQITSFQHLNELTARLSGMHLRRELKILTGSFDMSNMVYAQFRIKSTGETWELRATNDNHGGGYLKKLS